MLDTDKIYGNMDYPLHNDRRAEGYVWCLLHGWYSVSCDECEEVLQLSGIINQDKVQDSCGKGIWEDGC